MQTGIKLAGPEQKDPGIKAELTATTRASLQRYTFPASEQARVMLDFLLQMMNLVAPEWSARWVKSQLALYDTNGWLAKGPAGLEYISIMVAEHEIALLVAACQAGLKGLDREKILEAIVKMQTTTPQKQPGGGWAGNENLGNYLKHGYVAVDGAQPGDWKGPWCSNTYEYAYDDWCVAQLALALGRKDLAETFLKRSQSWRNQFDAETGLARPRKANGEWQTPFDPYHRDSFVEGNAWQYTWFVPQDVPGLVQAMGRERFVSRLNEAFEKSAPTRFNAAGERFDLYPLNHGNQPTDQDPHGNTFFSEIDVIDAQDAAVARLTPPPPIVNSHLSADGKFRFIFDSTTAPDLTAWSELELMPVVREWYPRLVALLPSDGYRAPEVVELEFRTDMGGMPAYTGGCKISLNALWIASQLQGEAKGCVVHELCHVVQNYRQVLRANPQATLPPLWVTEGLADYIRWFLYEPQSKGAVIRDASQAKHDASYRVSANFLDWVVTTQDKALPQQLNTAAREGRYGDALWKTWTGKTVSELAAEWKRAIAEGRR
ncbi:MAG: glycoside hydrolase family 92 protein [Verrucomicrobia bacterium]|nr:glycoside hydrolase family 92 protein [Verrucomicrobiota bacterium]